LKAKVTVKIHDPTDSLSRHELVTWERRRWGLSQVGGHDWSVPSYASALLSAEQTDSVCAEPPVTIQCHLQHLSITTTRLKHISFF